VVDFPQDIAVRKSNATTVSRMYDFTWKQVHASWNQGSGSLQGTSLQSETVKHLHLLLILLRLFTGELLCSVSLVHVVFGEHGETPPIPAALLDLHILDNACVQSRMAHPQASLGRPGVGWAGHHHCLDLAFFVGVAPTRREKSDASVGGSA